ncbi:PIG-L deacetylase family protein [Kribbella pratensis]|uniref:LmbE family N-acetylglucosaminyl deacetylase n=1 Tax=Kribbella pratensis TaxID=2512112 RepID=A0A4V3GHC0_9ACTN|nr:PIG-L family deacetylase [Kribbella pratensis]TDW75627.1 LmbE family N-acetylglucosaminyl deacetylase [Kribbella pratensis]
MLPFQLGLIDGPVHLVALGAHPDDIEIGCGGTLLKLAESVPELSAEFVIATGTPVRLEEARRAAELFLPDCEVTVTSAELPDGRLPAYWNQTKELLEATARGGNTGSGRRPDLVFAPSKHDAHQDHRLIAELAPTVWRNHLVLHYEIPKWDGDISRPWLYVELTEEQMQDKVALLHKAYPSQVPHDWFDGEVFSGLARLRGMECRATYAEAFTTAKATLTW